MSWLKKAALTMSAAMADQDRREAQTSARRTGDPDARAEFEQLAARLERRAARLRQARRAG